MDRTFFLSHGPLNLCIDDSFEVSQFLKGFTDKVLSSKPRGILVVSAHWDTSRPSLTTNPAICDTIHDFDGFPDPMYQLRYPAPGAPELANKAKQLLKGAGFNDVEEDEKRGLDHGAWVPLMLMYPDAEIPVCQLSVQSSRSGTHHYEMGKALSSLKDDGYLIVGSGAATHNLSYLNAPAPSEPVAPWALEFDTWLKEALISGRYDDVNGYDEKAPNSKKAHPWPDHLYPLHVAMGAAGETSKAKLIHHSWCRGTLSNASYQFVAEK